MHQVLHLITKQSYFTVENEPFEGVTLTLFSIWLRERFLLTEANGDVTNSNEQMRRALRHRDACRNGTGKHILMEGAMTFVLSSTEFLQNNELPPIVTVPGFHFDRHSHEGSRKRFEHQRASAEPASTQSMQTTVKYGKKARQTRGQTVFTSSKSATKNTCFKISIMSYSLSTLLSPVRWANCINRSEFPRNS